MAKTALTIDDLKKEALTFATTESKRANDKIYGVTDGKAIGTFIEQAFVEFLKEKYTFEEGNSAKGIDLPGATILTDIKVTSKSQPQSSCPFRNAEQKIYGLGYNILVFVYDKSDNHSDKTGNLNFVSCSFIDKERTSDYSTTKRLIEKIKDGSNAEDISAYLNDIKIPLDEVGINILADRILKETPEQGYLTISNALQWRLQYGRVVGLAKDAVSGVDKLI